MSENEKDVKGTRDKIQNWLMAEGWNIAEQAHSELAWLIRAEDASGRRILVGQNKARPDLIHLEARVGVADEHRGKFESLPAEKRREILWKSALPPSDDERGFCKGGRAHADCSAHPANLSGWSHQRYLHSEVSNHSQRVIAVIWSIMQNLEGVEPPTESTKPKSH